MNAIIKRLFEKKKFEKFCPDGMPGRSEEEEKRKRREEEEKKCVSNPDRNHFDP